MCFIVQQHETNHCWRNFNAYDLATLTCRSSLRTILAYLKDFAGAAAGDEGASSTAGDPSQAVCVPCSVGSSSSMTVFLPSHFAPPMMPAATQGAPQECISRGMQKHGTETKCLVPNLWCRCLLQEHHSMPTMQALSNANT